MQWAFEKLSVAWWETPTSSSDTRRCRRSPSWINLARKTMQVMISFAAPVLALFFLLHPVTASRSFAQSATAAECGCTDDPPFVRNAIQSPPARADVARITGELSGDCATAAIASRKLGQLADPASVQPLIRVLRHKSCRVRSAAADALGQFRDHRAVAPLVGALSDSDPRVRSSAAWSLAELPDQAAVPALLIAVGDREKHVRQAAATALGNIGDPRAGPALTRALRDPEKHVRQAAAAGLGKLRRS
jgi:vesicle coat complex subunit